MIHKGLLAALLLAVLSGCAVYGDGYPYGRSYHHYDNHRHNYSSPVYVTPRYYYYDDRRPARYRHDSKRYVPVPPPRHDDRDRRYRDDHRRYEQSRNDYRRDQRQPERRAVHAQPPGKVVQQRVQQRYSQGYNREAPRRYEDQRRY